MWSERMHVFWRMQCVGRVIEFVAKFSSVHSLVMHSFMIVHSFYSKMFVSNVQIRNDHRF